MFKLAVIGTNWISQQFVEAAIQTKEFCLHAVYSRDVEKAREFGSPYNAEAYYDNLDALGADESVDAVYIASPNSFHAPQAGQMLKAGKHVILLLKRCLKRLKKIMSCCLKPSCHHTLRISKY